MSFDTGLMKDFDCRHVVVARWNQSDTTTVVPSANSIVTFLETVGYKLGNKDRIGRSPTPTDLEQFMILPLCSANEATRICNDSEQKGFAINKTRILFTPLLGPNGMRLQDANDFMRISQDHFENDELLDLLMISIRLELPKRIEVIENGFTLIKRGISELVENASCEMFGSFSSKVRRNGYSDIDINIESVDKPGQRGSTSVRPLQQILTNPKCLINNRLTKEELNTYPQEDIIKVMYRCFHENNVFRKNFEIRYVLARTPILVFKSIQTNGMSVSFDVSVRNQKGVDKANLLDEFIIKDRSKDNKMKNAMLFVVHWARSNKLLPGAYPDENPEPKTNLNSYILNQMIIHFVQAAADRILVHPQAKAGARVDDYNFDPLFTDHSKFLREFFKYYASFDFSNKAIYGKQAMQKTTLFNVHGAKITPLMMMDPMDCTHNISAKVTEVAVKQLNGLIRNTLFILKQKLFHINYLLETNQTALNMMKSRETKISVTTNVVEGVEHNYMSIHLPDVITNSADLMLLLTRVLRFDVSPNNEGPSVTDLYCSVGVLFSVQAKTWIGRRNKKRQLKNARNDLTPLQLDVVCSDMYQYEEQPVAELRIVMNDVPKTPWKYAYIEMFHGQVSDIRDAMHYLMDQFIFNNLNDLVENGIQSIADIPSAQTT